MKKISGELRKTIGDAVAKDERTQKQISKDAGVKHSHLYQILNGTKQKVTPIAEALCKTLGINPEDYNGGRKRTKRTKIKASEYRFNDLNGMLSKHIKYQAKVMAIKVLQDSVKKLEVEIGER